MFSSLLLSFRISFLSFFISTPDSIYISGTIADAATGRPLEKVYVYIVKGEEEFLSDIKGRFSLVTNEKAPVKVYFEKAGYKAKAITISKSNTTALSIKLHAY